MVGMRGWLTGAALVLGFGAVSLHAQHTPAAKFDLTKSLTVDGNDAVGIMDGGAQEVTEDHGGLPECAQ